MLKKTILGAAFLFAASLTAMAAPQLPPPCQTCDCPDPSCYQCHSSCGNLGGGLQGVKRRAPKRDGRPDSNLLYLASSPVALLAAGLLGRRVRQALKKNA